MGILSTHEAIVWWEFHQGKTTSEIASEYEENQPIPKYILDLLMAEAEEKEKTLSNEDKITKLKDTAYVSKVLNRARQKIEKELRNHANSHRLDIESLQDYNGLLIGYDYQANTSVYIVFTMKLGIITWYKHDNWAGKLCPDCPKHKECRETLDTIMEEYNITLRPDEEQLHMTEQSIAIFTKLAAKDILRYKRTSE
jgi:hypothetical protein